VTGFTFSARRAHAHLHHDEPIAEEVEEVIEGSK
jgi:hypothetical protein